MQKDDNNLAMIKLFVLKFSNDFLCQTFVIVMSGNSNLYIIAFNLVVLVLISMS